MLRFLSCAAFSLVALSPTVDAQLMGQTLDAEWHYPSFGGVLESHSVVVSAGVELPSTAILNDSKFAIDIGDDWIEFQFNAASSWSATTFNGWLFRDALGALPPFGGFAVDSYSAGVTGVGGISTGFNDDEVWANFAGMQVAGSGDWIRLKVTPGGPVLGVSGLVAGQSALITVDNTTSNGSVGLAYSLTGAGPTTVFTGSCGFMSVDLSAPISVIGTFTAIGTTMSLNMNIPLAASGRSVWIQGLDFGSCTLTNGLALTVL
jgi:hypothetical protein